MTQLLSQKQSAKRVFSIPLHLHPAQQTIENSKARFKLVRAGRKFGKTKFAQKVSLKWVGPPDSPIWYIGPTYKQTKLIVWNEFKRLIPPESLAKKPNETDLIFTFKNGSEIYLMGGDEPDSLRGPAPAGVVLEEAALHRSELWSNVIRPNLTVRKSPALFITTPKGFNWFKDLEDEARRRRLLGDDSWECFHYTIYDNPYIDKAEIESSRADCDSEAVWRQEYMAEYESSVGRVFNSFSDARHVRRIVLPTGTFNAWRGIDWGMRDNTAALWGFVTSGRLHIYREHLENNLSAPAQAQIIRNKTTAAEHVVGNIIGHDAKREDSTLRGLTVLWHFSSNGISPIKASSKNKQHSRQMIQQLIQQDRLIVDPSCVQLRKQLLAYEWKDTAMEKTDDGNDDAVDALHHLVELLQYDLFLDHSLPVEPTMDEICRKIAEERTKQWAHPFDPNLQKPAEDAFSDSFENSPAGYL